MTSTTWTQNAGMDSGTDSDGVVTYAEAAQAAAEAAAASEAAAAASEGDAEIAANSATTAKNAAEASATASASSASAASSSASTATAASAAAASSAAAAAASAAETGSDVTAAETAAVNAASSAVNAGTSETNAASSATSAASSATSANASYISSASSAVVAEGHKDAAAASAVEASGYVSDAADEVALAAVQASNAATSASNAAASAATATSEAATATTQASNATTSATAAATSATNAATSETNAATSLTDAESARDQSQDARDTANLHKLAAEAAATSATSTASALTGFDLEAIAESKAVTAVDVFVYDTSKDSDGGAWRKRTQGTSWYNETLNTSTRGSRREFPAVAVIVAESNKITIYDGDDPSLPMWMVFNASTANNSFNATAIFGHSGAPISSVSALNGEIVVGCSAVTSNLGVRAANFISDSAWYKRQFNDMAWLLTLADRNINDASVKWVSIGSQDIVNHSVNDVAMTVLPDAPIDPATGLPVPTIAVATAGGVSVIKDDGNVWDISGANWGSFSTAVSFDGGTLYFIQSILYWLACDVAGLSQDYVLPDGYNSANDTYPFKRVTLSESIAYTSSSRKVAAGGSWFDLAHPASTAYPGTRLVQHKRGNTGGPNLVAYTTSTYNTGWMNGDIKGAFLSDTDDTDLVGSGELVTNGTFDTDTSGWSGRNANTVLAVSSARLSVSAGAADVAYAHQQITAAAGVPYVLTLDYFDITGTPRVYIGTGPGTNTYYDSGNLSGNGSLTVTFTPTSANPYISLYAETSSTSGLESQYDNISVKLADADRSVNSNGLVIEGSITRTPVATGADLVSYSGFSASNYLEMPYNPDLDFGTGDFCVMGWVKDTSTATNFFLQRRDTSFGVDFGLTGIGSEFRFETFGVDVQSVGGGRSSGVWKFVCGLRRSSTLELYVDGALNNTGSNSANLTNTSAILTVGVSTIVSGAASLASLALLRISATAPTAEQISRIYNDEKVLFQENAQATLYGASDAVTALAHDPVTDLLHVGTSAGRSVFQGLRRVDNTTTAVGTAISASNGLVVEE